MIDFQPITLENKATYEPYLSDGNERGCGYTFANLFLWGRQNGAVLHDHLVLFSHFQCRSVYPFPVGNGDKKPVLDAIIVECLCNCQAVFYVNYICFSGRWELKLLMIW